MAHKNADGEDKTALLSKEGGMEVDEALGNAGAGKPQKKPPPDQAIIDAKGKLLPLLRHFQEHLERGRHLEQRKKNLQFNSQYVSVSAAELQFFSIVALKCNKLHAMANEGQLEYRTVADIITRIDDTFFTLLHKTNEKKDEKESVKNEDSESSGPEQAEHWTHYCDTKQLPLSEHMPSLHVNPSDKMKRFKYVQDEIKKMQKDCYQYIEKDGLESKYAPHAIKGFKIAGIIIATFAAAAAGIALMFFFGNYGHEIFADKIADVIAQQLGIFLTAGSALGLGGFFASKHVFFKTGANAEASHCVKQTAEALKEMIRAKINYDDPGGEDESKNIFVDWLTGNASMSGNTPSPQT